MKTNFRYGMTSRRFSSGHLPIFVFLFLVYLFVFTQGDIECDTYNRCDKCLDVDFNGTCSWCNTTGTCNFSSVISSSCSVYSQFSCSTAEEETVCRLNTDLGCEGCTSIEDCGWCGGEDGSCLYGNDTGPLLADCVPWIFGNYSTCESVLNCSLFEDCFECAQQPECGYCDSGNYSFCADGNATGPLIGTCSNGSRWIININTTGSCAEEVVNCTKHSTCDSCTADSSRRCGWCGSSEHCMEYDPNQSEQPSNCEMWMPDTCEVSCLSLSASCDSCNKKEKCGWCSHNGTVHCVEGGSGGPISGDIVCETWGKGICPYNCSLLSNCESCVVYNQVCSWCNIADGARSSCIQATDNNCAGIPISGGSCTAPVSSCVSYQSCETCVSDSDCGWCGSGCNSKGACSSAATSCSGSTSATKWILIGVFTSLGTGVIASGMIAWYRLYWKKRHYYETLK